MKRYYLLILVCLLLLAGCGSNLSTDSDSNSDSISKDITATASDESGDIVEITEKMFIAQCNDVYLNPDDYVGKQVKIEGILDIYTGEDGELSYGVIRYGPGCCSNDGVAGFEVKSDPLDLQIEDWVEVIGTFRKVELGEFTNVVVEAEKVTRMKKRGVEYVTQ